MTGRRIRVTLLRDGSMCAVPVPFDPKAVFGRVRAPVRVTLNGYTYRSTIAAMGPSNSQRSDAHEVRGGTQRDRDSCESRCPRVFRPVPGSFGGSGEPFRPGIRRTG